MFNQRLKAILYKIISATKVVLITKFVVFTIIFFYWAYPVLAQEPANFDFTLLIDPARADYELMPAADPVPPQLEITLATTQTAPGDLFIGVYAFNGTIQPQVMIIENNGKTILKKDNNTWVLDFKVLTDSIYSYFDFGISKFILTNERFQEIGEVNAVGYLADTHDLQLSPDGQHYLLMVYKERNFDMSTIVSGGVPTATVISCLIQEVDLDNNLVWEWDSWIHTPITHSVASLTGNVVDYDHCNALEYDTDGNILVSSRNLNSVTKIDKFSPDGDILWRLGGVANDFTFTNDSGFALQHDIRRLPDGHITLFDNGTGARGYSRGVEYEINESTMMITRTWEYTGPFSFCCGNAQRLPNGNTLINFAIPGIITEVAPDGTKVFEAKLTAPAFTYRAFRFPTTRIYYFPLIFK